MNSENKEAKLSPEETVTRWLADIRIDRKSQYLYRDRKEHLELLMGYLKTNDVSMDDASFLKRKVVEALVHTEGMKNQGKYKNWQKTVEEEYDDWIQRTYVPGVSIPKASQKLDYILDPDIVGWAKKKFGNDIHPNILKDCHQIGNVLNIMFIDEFYR